MTTTEPGPATLSTDEKLGAALDSNPDLTSKELAEKAGIGASTAARILRGWEEGGAAFRTERAKGAATWRNLQQVSDAAEPADLSQATDAELMQMLDDAVPAEAEAADAELEAIVAADIAMEVEMDDCPYCPEPFFTQEALVDHIAKVHEAELGDAHERGENAVLATRVADAEGKPKRTLRADKLAKGNLRGWVEQWLDEHPDEEITPSKLGKVLDRSPGAIFNALQKLVELGSAVQTSAKPRTYKAAAETGG